ISLLNEASKAYYQLDSPILSDLEYDKLYDELLLLEKQTGVILSGSPTQNVGYEVLSDLKKVQHEFPMLSLDKTKEPQKLKSWLGEKEGLLSWKMDGLTIVLHYNNGSLRQAITRGNGQVGEDVTHNAKVFKNLPLKIPFQKELVLRGEGVISLSDFRKINEELGAEEAYKNPRNLCSGTVRQLNSEIAAKRKVMFYAFSVVKAEGKEFEDGKNSQMEWLKELGFPVVEYVLVTKDTVEEEIQKFQKAIPTIDFATDGLVLTYNSRTYSQSLGATSKFPRDAIAFKWADETAETTLRELIWNTSRTGLINPIAVFDPVDLEGSTVSRASVHNVSILEELQLGIGDTIRVYKANMIIPQIAENVTKKGGAIIPKHCSVCGEETEIRALREGKALYCTNPNCQAQRVRSLTHFVSRDAMNIEGLSEETLKKFVDRGFIQYYPDIFELHQYEKEIKEMEGFGEKSYDNLIRSIEKSKSVFLPHFIYALGISNIGLSNAKLLCKHFRYDLERMKQATEEELIQIEGFGSIIAHNVYRYFHNEKDMELLQQAIQKLDFQLPKEEEAVKTLDGVTVVITGDLQYFSNRKELQQKIEDLGGKVTGSVTKKTAFLINNDVLSESSKNKKAKELGVPVLSEEDFLEKYPEIKE
ncbi:MAG: NAD-dependent DNA ligase LigA, partial [Epulopiscium sp.]|nr:NAD-dependent DNA ligase LigA [Candidatus Epulonipiscium sp.]